MFMYMQSYLIVLMQILHRKKKKKSAYPMQMWIKMAIAEMCIISIKPLGRGT